MNQGEIWLVNLNPSNGREQAGKRPVLIIIGNMMNHQRVACATNAR